MSVKHLIAAALVLACAHGAAMQQSFTAVDQDGRTVDFYRDVTGDRPAVINFVFTSCTAVCPLLGANFAAVQRQLAQTGRDGVALISISVDPEKDTPERLRAWRDARGGKPGWTLLTGEKRTVAALLAHLGVPSADPASHTSSVLVGRRGAWKRLDGLSAPSRILAELGEQAGAGATIFMEGTNRGRPVEASLASGVPLQAADAACANCHGRDGRGRSEAGRPSPDIRWSRLTAAYGVPRPYGRHAPPYTEATLLRALTDGVDSSGAPLDAAMPRYRLDAADAARLFAFMRSIDARREPGVTPDAVQLGAFGFDGAAFGALPRDSVFERRLRWSALPTLPASDPPLLALAGLATADQLPTLDAWAARTGVPVVAAVTGTPAAGRPAGSNLLVVTPPRETHARALVDVLATRGARPETIAIVTGGGDWHTARDAAIEQLKKWSGTWTSAPLSSARHVLHLAPVEDVPRTASAAAGAAIYLLGDPGPISTKVGFIHYPGSGHAPGRLLLEALRRLGREPDRESLLRETALLLLQSEAVSGAFQLCYSPRSDSGRC